jgi:Methyltransferase domain
MPAGTESERGSGAPPPRTAAEPGSVGRTARQARKARARARHLYFRARLNRWAGRRARAAELCRRALGRCDYGRAYQLLAELELPGEDYLSLLGRVHRELRPATYVEIGVARGNSFALARPDTRAIGIDPAPGLRSPLGPLQQVFAQRSDEYFAHHDPIAELGGRRVRMAFIDGVHLFEYALRDFIHLEALADPDSLIFVHDCYPLDEQTSSRVQQTAFWSGDVWRLIGLLKRHRADLSIHTIAAPPTGLGVITRLDPSSRVLEERLPALIEEGLGMRFESIASSRPQALNLVASDWRRLRAVLAGG